MKICIAQTKSLKGNVQKNIKNHLAFIERAIQFEADLIIFPELSITNYEPDLAEELAVAWDNSIFDPFQEISNAHKITIGIGMPTKTSEGICISTLLFQPNHERNIYSKKLLHTDELPFFKSGNQKEFIQVNMMKIALGICYETLQLSHMESVLKQNVALYLASVAKPKNGVQKAYELYPKMARKYEIPIFMSNCVGYCDNFISSGQSAVWNSQGELVDQLNATDPGWLIFDTETEEVKKEQLLIEKGNVAHLKDIFELYINAKHELEKTGIYQWTKDYPSKSIIKNDLLKQHLFVLINNEEIIAAINISEDQEEEYQAIKWKCNNSKVLVIHRLVVAPRHQGNGYAKILMDFAENYALDHNYTSIRLDAYSKNKRIINFYENRSYEICGTVYFPGRDFEFYCMEKEL